MYYLMSYIYVFGLVLIQKPYGLVLICFAPPPSPLNSHPSLHFSSPHTSFSPMLVQPLSLISSSRLSPPLCFSPFSLSLLSPSHHSFSP